MGQYGSLGDVAPRAARWQILRNVTSSIGQRYIRGQLVHGYLTGGNFRVGSLRGGRRLVITTARTPGGTFYAAGWIPSSAARLRLEGVSGFGDTQIDPAVPGIISASGTAAGNLFTGIADVYRAGRGEGGSSSDAAADAAGDFIDPSAGSSFFESTGGKVVVVGGIVLALLATALIVIPKKKAAAANRRRRRNGGMTKAQAAAQFKEIYSGSWSDGPMVAEAWNNYTDGLAKDGQITMKQYETWTHPTFAKRKQGGRGLGSGPNYRPWRNRRRNVLRNCA